jgi:hypothetical protein
MSGGEEMGDGDLVVGLFDQNGRDDLDLFDIGEPTPDALADV